MQIFRPQTSLDTVLTEDQRRSEETASYAERFFQEEFQSLQQCQTVSRNRDNMSYIPDTRSDFETHLVLRHVEKEKKKNDFSVPIFYPPIPIPR